MNDSNPPATIDEYIAGFPPEVQAILHKVRATIREAAPEAQETINYQMPTFQLHGNLVHFAAHTRHIGFYPTPSGIENFTGKLAGYKSSKGAVQFPLDEPVPYELIAEITRFRVQENVANDQAKATGKKKKK